MKTIQFILILVILCVGAGSALECYDCKSDNYANCGNAGYDKEKESCDDLSALEKLAGIQQVCLKAVFEVNGVTETIRTCSKAGGSFNACTIYNVTSATYCGVCDKDLCNGSNIVITSTWMPIILVILVSIMKMI